ncbi:MAG: alkaline phosphatase family protein [Pyrinomonadaceae bacterium]
MPNPVQHLVVLMMENRSFDHSLGFLKSNSWKIDGLDGTETNPDTQGVPVRVSPDARYAGDFNPDPGHDFISVNEQIFSNSQGTGTGPFMKGFVKAYQGKTGNVPKSHNIMKCFGPGRLPALSTLAQEYAVCDRWHASVPGPTLPNRAFAFGATSLGRVDMNPNYLQLKTVFELLDRNNVSARLYYTDWTLGLANGYILEHSNKFLYFFDDFLKDCKKNKLPSFSFIEPRFNDFSDRGQFFPAADQHPDHNVFQGEIVIKAVYDAVTSNQQSWESTMLVITYDEHGGLYDHVNPPPTVNPDGRVSVTPPFNFDRLGVRVPAVIVSPFIPRGTIIHDKVFDHTSIIATARKLFLKNDLSKFLTQRDLQAKTFEDCLTLATPRQGKVNIPQPTDVPKMTGSRAMLAAAGGVEAEIEMASAVTAPAGPNDNPLSDFQATMIQHAFIVDSELPSKRQTRTLVSAIKTEQDAAEYLAAIRARIAKARKGEGRGIKSPAAKPAARKLSGKKAVKKASKKTTSRKTTGKKKASKKKR